MNEKKEYASISDLEKKLFPALYKRKMGNNKQCETNLIAKIFDNL